MIALNYCRWSVLGLIILQPAWVLALKPALFPGTFLLLGVTLGPLLVLLPGVWRLRARSLVITGCLLLLYFSFAVMEIRVNSTALIPAMSQIGLVVLYFMALPAIRRQRTTTD
jgi:uncharacterized membrane protein